MRTVQFLYSGLQCSSSSQAYSAVLLLMLTLQFIYSLLMLTVYLG